MSREPRRSGNPFLDDDDYGGDVKSGEAPLESFQMPATAQADTVPVQAPAQQPSQASFSPSSTLPRDATHGQVVRQQLCDEAPVPHRLSDPLRPAAPDLHGQQASDTAMDRQSQARRAGSAQYSGAGQPNREAAHQAALSTGQSAGSQRPIQPARQAEHSSNSDSSPGAQTVQPLQSSTIPGRQGSMPQQAGPIKHSIEGQSGASQGLQAAPSQQRLASTSMQGPEGSELVGSHRQTVLQSGLTAGSDAAQQRGSNTMGTLVQPLDAAVHEPDVVLHIADRQTLGSLPASGLHAVVSPGAGSALHLQQQHALPVMAAAASVQLPSADDALLQQPGPSSPAHGLSEDTQVKGLLGRAAPDSEGEEEESAASAQDRQRFMQSLQSPERGGSRTKNLAKGFGRMRAKAKNMLQTRNAGSPPADRPAVPQVPPTNGPAGGPNVPKDAELGKGSRFARDMTMMFAGLKKPNQQ